MRYALAMCSMCRLAQSYRQNGMETIRTSKEFVNDVDPATSYRFSGLGEKLVHTFMTNFVCYLLTSYTKILLTLGGNNVFTPTIYYWVDNSHCPTGLSPLS